MENGTCRFQQPFRMQPSATVSSMMREKELLPRHHWVIFFKRVDKIESIKEPEPVPLASDVSEISACPPSVGDDPSALPSPAPLPPPGSNSSSLFTGCQPLYASCCTILLYFLRYCALRFKTFSLLLCVYFVCVICGKSINLWQYSTG